MTATEETLRPITWQAAGEASLESAPSALPRLPRLAPAAGGIAAGDVGAGVRRRGRGFRWSEPRETGLLVAWDSLITLLIFSAIARGVQTDVPLSGYVVAAVVPLVTAALGGYRRVSWLRAHLVRPLGLLLLATVAALWVQGIAMPDRLSAAASLLAVASVPIGCVVGRWLLALARSATPERVLIVGGGTTGIHVQSLARRQRRSPISVIGYLDSEAFPGLEMARLGDLDDLPRLLAEGDVDRVVVAFSRRRDHEIMRIVRDCDAYAVDVDVVPRFFDFVGPEPRVHSMGGMAFVNVRGRRFSLGQRLVKRTFDLMLSAIVLLVTFPLFVAAAVAIVLESGRPVFFRQRRIGADGRPFVIVKFRTMRPDAHKRAEGTRRALVNGELSLSVAVDELKAQGSEVVTRVGAFLRRTSIDELPQLWNVLFGHMSLVGPRPLQEYEVVSLERWELYRHQMRPGITGLWQVTGRSELDWEERMQLDYTYVRHWSPMLDLRILLDTVPAAIRGRGAY